MDIDGVDAQVLYPNLGIGPLFLLDDLELQFACLRAYNDFLSEFCSTDAEPPRRYRPDSHRRRRRPASRRLKHCAKLPGPARRDAADLIRAASRSTAALTSRCGRPRRISACRCISICAPAARHTGALIGQTRANLLGEKCALLNLASLANYEALSRIVFGGVLERFPKLKFVSVEGNIGWLGYLLEKSDRTYKRHRHWTKLELPNPPSHYYFRQIYSTFIEDKIGMMIRKEIGVDNLMWSSDYPHTDTTWPDSRKYIEDKLWRSAAGGSLQDPGRQRGQALQPGLTN